MMQQLVSQAMATTNFILNMSLEDSSALDLRFNPPTTQSMHRKERKRLALLEACLGSTLRSLPDTWENMVPSHVVEQMLNERRDERAYYADLYIDGQDVDMKFADQEIEDLIKSVKEHRIRRELVLQIFQRMTTAAGMRKSRVWLSRRRVQKILKLYGRHGSPLLHKMRDRDLFYCSDDEDFDDRASYLVAATTAATAASQNSDTDSDFSSD